MVYFLFSRNNHLIGAVPQLYPVIGFADNVNTGAVPQLYPVIGFADNVNTGAVPQLYQTRRLNN